MKKYVFLTLCFWTTFLFSQNLSEPDIKKFSQKVNSEMRGKDNGTGITLKNCNANGRTLIFQYNVPNDWYPTENMKEEVIQNSKNLGFADIFFKNDIDVEFDYFIGRNLQNKISVKANEFFNFKLGDYISLKGHPKAKDVDLKLKVPFGWEVKEGDRPNIVKKFVYNTNTYIILIKDNKMFISRKEAKELLSDQVYVKGIVTGVVSSLESPEIINQKVVTIDSYPAIEFTYSGYTEILGIKMKMISKSWFIIYEDKFILLGSSALGDKEFYALESLYNLITNSVIFPEHYN